MLGREKLMVNAAWYRGRPVGICCLPPSQGTKSNMMLGGWRRSCIKAGILLWYLSLKLVFAI